MSGLQQMASMDMVTILQYKLLIVASRSLHFKMLEMERDQFSWLIV
jgi:hypothetical protein